MRRAIVLAALVLSACGGGGSGGETQGVIVEQQSPPAAEQPQTPQPQQMVLPHITASHDVRSGAGVPAAFDTGQTIGYTSSSALVVRDGDWLTAPAGVRAWYAEISLTGNVTRLGAEVSFAAGTGGENGVLAMMPWQTSITTGWPTVPATGVHFTLSRWRWGVDYVPSPGAAVTRIGGGVLDTPLLPDTPYTVDIFIDGDTAYLLLPDNTTREITSPHIASLAGPFACWEFFQLNTATDDRPKIRRMWASSLPGQRPGA